MLASGWRSQVTRSEPCPPKSQKWVGERDDAGLVRRRPLRAAQHSRFFQSSARRRRPPPGSAVSGISSDVEVEEGCAAQLMLGCATPGCQPVTRLALQVRDEKHFSYMLNRPRLVQGTV